MTKSQRLQMYGNRLMIQMCRLDSVERMWSVMRHLGLEELGYGFTIV